MNFSVPLSGPTMICDCDLGELRHGHVLIQAFSDNCVGGVTGERDAAKVDAMSVACVMDGVRG